MRIDREEKRSLKKLFVGVLVIALLVTMLPIQTNQLTEIKAAGTAKFDEAIFGNAPTIEVESSDELDLALSNVSPGDAVIIKLMNDIMYLPDASGFNTPLIFPEGNVAIDLGSHSLYVNLLSFPGTAPDSNIAFYGDIMSKISGFSMDETNIYDQVLHFAMISADQPAVQFNGATNLMNLRFEVRQGAKCVIKGRDMAVTGADWTRYYKEGSYNYINCSNAKEIVEYIGPEFYNVEGTEKVLDIGEVTLPYSSEAPETVFEKGAIPEDVKIKYKDNYYENYNQEAVVVESRDIGLYHKTNVESEIIVDAILQDWMRGNTYVQPITDNTAYLEITDSYLYSLVGEGYSKVTFNEGAIPSKAVYGEDVGLEYSIEKVVIKNAEQEFSLLEDGFDVQLHFNTSLPIYNEAVASVTASDSSAVWIPWMEEYCATTEYEYILEANDITEEEALSYGTYIKAGSKIVLKPQEETYISNIRWGQNILPNSSLIAYGTDGTIVITVPNYATGGYGLSFDMGEIIQLEATSEDLIIPEPDHIYEEDGVSIPWYGSAFSVACDSIEYVICDASIANSEATGWSAEGIPVPAEDGTYTNEYYLMSVLMIEDENDQGEMVWIPSGLYGERCYVTYTYTLDTKSPILTAEDVSAVAGTDIPLTLNGEWENVEESKAVDTVWTNQKSVTLTVKEPADNGTDFAGYNFGNGWQEAGTATYSGDGVYDIRIQVRDAFDEVKSRQLGAWVTSIGIDTTAPTLLFTDAKNPTQSELKSDSTYEGNLHVVCEDGNGSGFAEINLYKQDGENWVLSNDLLIATEEASYIAPTTKNEVYRIEVKDTVGNTRVYENITVAGYVQDVEVNIGNTIATYGEELSIPVRIKNNSSNVLTISLFALREDATDDVFSKEIGALTELAAGETFATNVIIPKGADAAEYSALLDIQYTNVGGNLETNIAKVYSRRIEATIEKATGTGSISVADLYYGEVIQPVVSSDTNGTENVMVYYKESNVEDSLYIKAVPTAVGAYDVKAVFPATANYEEVVVESTFTISRMKADASMYVIGTIPDASGIFKQDVVIKAQNGYLLSTSENGTFADTLVISESTDYYVFYVKTSTGAITDAIALGKIVIDKSVPQDMVPPAEVETEEIEPTAVGVGRVRLVRGTAYTLGEGSWHVNGDSTNYAGGITFYVPTTGDYEITQ